MYIHVKTITGATSVYLIGDNESVRLLKAKIMLREGIPIENQRLVLNDKELTDDMSLQDEGVTEETEVHLLVAMRGGPYTFLRSSAISDDEEEEENVFENDNHPPFEAIEECLRKYEQSLGADSSPPAVIYLMYESKGDMHIIRAYRTNSEDNSPSSSSSSNFMSVSQSVLSNTISDTNSRDTLNLQQKMSLLRLKMDSKRLNKRFNKPAQKSSLNPRPILPNIGSSGVCLSSSSTSVLKSHRKDQPIQHLSETNDGLPNLQRCISYNGASTAPSSKDLPVRKISKFSDKHSTISRPQTATPFRNSFLSQSSHSSSSKSHNLESNPLKSDELNQNHSSSVSKTPSEVSSTSGVAAMSTTLSTPSYNLPPNDMLISTPQVRKQISSKNVLPDLTSSMKKPRTTCHVCQKRLNLVGTFHCRCGLTLCQKHLYPEEHVCSIDYKQEGKTKLQNENPFIAPNKLSQM